jgi:hypothetical protein
MEGKEMKLKELEGKGFSFLTNTHDGEMIVSGVDSCDLLSWVMAKGKKGNLWITVQTHTNSVAVASLLEMSGIIIPDGIEVEPETIEKANDENIAVLSTDMSPYQIFKCLYEMGIE